MFTLSVTGWQIAIIFTLVLARLIGDIFRSPNAIYWVCCAWILFTLLKVFSLPLMIFQLVNIFWATATFAANDKALKTETTAGSTTSTERVAATRSKVENNPKSHALKTLEDFYKCCDSPAEEAFLDVLVRHYSLKPTDDCLMGQGITVELQFPIDKCRADFLINDCLIVEIDGAAYHSSKDARARDTRRDKFIRRQGFHILRIPAKYPLYQHSATINKVRRAISIVAAEEVKKNYADEDRLFHVGAEDCGLRYKNTPKGLFKATQETILRNT